MKPTKQLLESLARAGIKLPGPVEQPRSLKPIQARYTLPGKDGMNGLERDYGKYLEDRKRSGEIVDYGFQVMKLLLVRSVSKTEESEGIKSSWYEPDFTVYENDMTISQHETKGYKDLASDGWLKFKAAASLFPFTFYFIQKVSKAKGTWDIKRYAR